MTSEEAIKIIDHLGIKGSQDYNAHEIGEALTMAIEVLKHQTPKKGEWIIKSLDKFRKYSVTCPFCKSEYVDNYDGYIDAERFNFCPNCGADMRGDTE